MSELLMLMQYIPFIIVFFGYAVFSYLKLRQQELEIVAHSLNGLKQSVISNQGNLIRVDLSKARFAVLSTEKKTVAVVVLGQNVELSKRQEKHAYKLIQNEIQERLEQNAYR